MRVKELTLHNFRGIKDLHLEFDDKHNVVVLVGVNGVGKSSILDCIALLFSHFQKVIDRHVSYYGVSYQNLLLSESDAYIGSYDTQGKVTASFGRDIDLGWSINASSIMGEDEEEIIGSLNRKTAVSGSQIKIRDFFFYTHDRMVLRMHFDFDKLDRFNDRTRTIADMFGKEEIQQEKCIVDFQDFSEWFRSAEDLENEQRLAVRIEYRDPVIEAVRRSIYSLLGNNYESLTFKRSIGKMIISKFGKELPLESLSDGEKSLLAMVGDLSRRLAENYVDRDDDPSSPLDIPALVLIDEIELHLHPEWQRAIIPKLTEIFPYCQFIVTTHSPQVLSHVDPDCIHILDYEGDNVVVKRPESSYGLDSNRILEDILGVSKRPQEIADRLQELFEYINDNNLEDARKIVTELRERIGSGEPELARAEATIARREIIGR
jgi:predicted ATP-binding protein involved in virulence